MAGSSSRGAFVAKNLGLPENFPSDVAASDKPFSHFDPAPALTSAAFDRCGRAPHIDQVKCQC
jgi:hypothetical protein